MYIVQTESTGEYLFMDIGMAYMIWRAHAHMYIQATDGASAGTEYSVGR